jgi:selenoprotein W-related protein
LADAVEAEFGVKPHLIKSGGGVFEVEVDGDLIFSKRAQFRFPEHQEIIDILKTRQ